MYECLSLEHSTNRTGKATKGSMCTARASCRCAHAFKHNGKLIASVSLAFGLTSAAQNCATLLALPTLAMVAVRPAPVGVAVHRYVREVVVNGSVARQRALTA
jgi:hypothetical protein